MSRKTGKRRRTGQKRREYWPYFSDLILNFSSHNDCRSDVRYIIGINNVSSQGEKYMVIPMVGLVNLVVFISNNSFDVTIEDRYRLYKSRGRWSCEIFSFSLSIHGFHTINFCIHVSSVGYSCICFSLIRKTVRQTQENFLICCWKLYFSWYDVDGYI